MNIDGTSCIIKVWGSFVQKLLGISRWHRSIKPSMEPCTPKKLVLSIDRLHVAGVWTECGPDPEILARALGPLGTLPMNQRHSPPQHTTLDPVPSLEDFCSLVASGWRLQLFYAPPQHLLKDKLYRVYSKQWEQVVESNWGLGSLLTWGSKAFAPRRLSSPLKNLD